MRAVRFAQRNFREMLRDPVSYIFCVGFPIFMLLLFALINRYTEGHTPFFEVPSLAPGIMVFSLSFVMLSMSLLVSKDVATSFLNRLFTSPMTTDNFVLGYCAPGFLVGVFQLIITCAASLVLGLVMNTPLNVGYLALCLLATLPSVLLFVAFGVLFGTLLNDKSAPGISSIIISGAGILGGCWMPLETMGSFGEFCKALPFYPAVLAARAVLGEMPLTFASFWGYELEVLAYAAVILLLAVVVFRRRMYTNK